MKLPLALEGWNGYSYQLEFELRNVYGFQEGAEPIIGIDATFALMPENAQMILAHQPYLVALYGALGIENKPQAGVAHLRMPDQLPTYLASGLPMRLSFALSPRSLHTLEDYRIATGGQDLTLHLDLRGIVSLKMDTLTARPVVGLNSYSHDSQLFVPQSEWVRRILPSLGYRHSAIIELPLTDEAQLPEAYRDATLQLEAARSQFADKHYGAAVQRCRQAKEALMQRSATWSVDTLAPLVGEVKAKAVDDTLKATFPLYTGASHPTTPKGASVEVTRDDAAFVIESLAITLRYVAHILQSQSEGVEPEQP